MCVNPRLEFRSEYDVATFLARHERSLRAFGLEREAKGIAGFPHDETTFRRDLIGSLSEGKAAFEIWDVDSVFMVLQGDATMTCFGGGPVHAGLVLNEAETILADGDGSVCRASQGAYRLHLEIRRAGDRVVLSRAREVTERLAGGVVRSYTLPEPEADRRGFRSYTGTYDGPQSVEASWNDFVQAARDYWRWVLFEFPRDADWLLEVPIFQQWRDEADSKT